jgi:broad specificity phosphatase PhoE
MSSPSTRSVVVVRHGERLDYVMRNGGGNWVATSEQPWNPPLTDKGREQAKALGLALPGILQDFNLPPIGAIYSSPLVRCRQTGAGLAVSNDDLKVRVELGLVESLNENFFRSWAVAGSDGTWGYKKKEQPVLDPETLHPASKVPVQESILNWKASKTDEETLRRMDHGFASTTSIDTPYSLHPPNFESFRMQRSRMADTMQQLAQSHEDETIVLVSHGMW